MMKRLVDVTISAVGLLLLSPLLAIILFLVWRQDGQSPLYIGERAARGGGSFGMVKIRSMIVGADRTGVESTSASDMRITKLGHFIRRYKLDELTQLWNVLVGDMSLVGPRPNTMREVAKYTVAEQKLLTVRPGITDIASIVFSDEGEILKYSADPDGDYDQLIRPWKSKLGIFYVERASLMLDFSVIILTVIAIFNRPNALHRVAHILERLNAPEALVDVARRDSRLEPTTLPV